MRAKRPSRGKGIHLQTPWNDPDYRKRVKELQVSEEENTKLCTGCWIVKPLSDFMKMTKGGRKGVSPQCRSCTLKKQKEEYANGKGRDERLKRLFGSDFGLEQYEALLQQQGGGCAICGRKDSGRKDNRLSVDHNHETGAVRGILCVKCNSILGMTDDNPNRLEAAARYLRAHSNKAASPTQSP